MPETFPEPELTEDEALTQMDGEVMDEDDFDSELEGDEDEDEETTETVEEDGIQND